MAAIFWGLALLLGLPALAAGREDDLDPIIGIDLGTMYSRVGIYRNGRVEIIPNDRGSRAMPSYIAFTDEGELFGEAARRQAIANPSQTVFGVKHLVGRRFERVSRQDLLLLPFKIVERSGGPHISVTVKGEDKTMAPEEVYAMVLTKVREIAENYLGKEVKKAVITLPTYFNDQQRQATRDAGALAGLEVVRMLHEPSAAAMAYGLDKEADKTILVYDLGGSTFDVTLFTFTAGYGFHISSTNGNSHLGGEDLDQRVLQHFMEVFQKKYGKDMSKDKRAVQKLRQEVEKTKHALSWTHQASVEIEDLFDGVDFSETLTRDRFEEINSDLFKSTLGPVKQVMEDTGTKKKDIDEIVLVGGSTRIPKVQQLVKDFFKGREPNNGGIDPDEAVVYGAAVEAGRLSGEYRADEL